jgi:aspartate-semialdehyde dehydrogenase
MTNTRPIICIVGANGLVGGALIALLNERNFPYKEIRKVSAKDTTAASFEGVDLVLMATSHQLARELAPLAVAQGATVIDHSSAWRLDDDILLIVPEINGHLLNTTPQIIATPNCTIPGFAMAIDALNKISPINDVVVTTMQAASGAGRAGLEQFMHCDSVLPHCESFLENGFSTEEEKMLFETRKVLNNPHLKVTMTCTRVPVKVGHAASILFSFDTPITVAQARTALSNYPGIELLDDTANDVYPTSATAVGKDTVQVGRLRLDHDGKRLWMWQVTDNLRKGAALNSIQIAEQLLARHLCR